MCHKPHYSVLHISRNIGLHVESVAETPVVPLLPNATEFRPEQSELLNQISCTGTFEFRNNSWLGIQIMVNRQTLLWTAMIRILDSVVDFINCRALLDNGSEASFISEHFMQKLCFPRWGTRQQATCLGSYSIATNFYDF